MVISMCVHACEHVHNLNDCVCLHVCAILYIFVSMCVCAHLCFNVF